MSAVRENLERKLVAEEVLSYASKDPRVMDVEKQLGNVICQELWEACSVGNLKIVKEMLEKK